jgi:peptidoglycan-associated lipoprotein
MQQRLRNKKIITNLLLVTSLLSAVVLTGCKSSPMVDKPAAVEDRSQGAQGVTNNADNAVDTTAIKELALDGSASNAADNALNDPNNILSKRSIYFDFNSDIVKPEFRPLIEAHAKYLLTHSKAKMVVQGFTDERGTREYNLSLGQRRSVAVKKALNLSGVQDQQIETVSYGEEKANTSCADEACFKTNRRADISYDSE